MMNRVATLIAKELRSGMLKKLGPFQVCYGKTFGHEGRDHFTVDSGLYGAIGAAKKYMVENSGCPRVTVYQPDSNSRGLHTVCHLYREADGRIVKDKWGYNDKRTVGECRAGDHFVYLGERYIRTNGYMDIQALRICDGVLVHLLLTETVKRTQLASP